MYKSLYPSITSEFNMAPNTIIGHINILDKAYDDENRFNRDNIKYKREGQFIDDLQSHVWIEFFHRWFKFASYEEMYDDVIYYWEYIKRPNGNLHIHYPDGSVPAFKRLAREDTTYSPFIKIRSERDRQLFTGERKVIIPKFDFESTGFKSFTDIFNYYQQNPVRRING